MSKFIFRFLATIALSALTPAMAAAAPTILASIKPLALIAQEVIGEHGQVETLLPITASPHDYPLKMSDHRRLRDADLVIWVGPELEGFLARPLAQVGADGVISAYTLPGIQWPEKDERNKGDKSGNHQAQEKGGSAMKHYGDEHEGHNHLHHTHASGDPHIWLDPRNADVIANAIAEKMAIISPASALAYRENAARFIAQNQALDQKIAALLAPVSSVGFGVYHEGYSHFVSRYNLHQVGYVTYAPERRPGAKHLAELQKVLKQEGKCLFLEPYYQADGMRAIATSLGLAIGTLDPIGDQQTLTYHALMERLAASFLTCLADTIQP